MSHEPTRLKRALNRWDLILYGVIVIQLTAPMPVFGVLSARADGHVVTTILLAMVAMAFTAISYGRMAQAYPSAGSAFTYVTREFSPLLGYVTGWAMLMDYVLNPLICIIWGSRAAMNFAPQVPYAVSTVCCGSLSSGKFSPSRSRNFASFAGASGEIPSTAIPDAARLARLSRKSHASFVQPGVIAAG